MDELEVLDRDIGDKWKILGRRLKVPEELEIIDVQYENLTEKASRCLNTGPRKEVPLRPTEF